MPQDPNPEQEIDKAFSTLYGMLLHEESGTENQFDSSFKVIIANQNLLTSQHNRRLIDESSPTTGLNFLMLACKYGNIEVVKLLTTRLNLNNKNKIGWTASDFAWESKKYDCLINLLDSDGPYPQKFDIDHMLASADKVCIQEIVLRTQIFHDSIQAGNLAQIQSFVFMNPNIRFAYNSNNRCALRTAVESRKFDVYRFLCSKNFDTGIDDKAMLLHLLVTNLEKPIEMKLLSRSRDLSGKTMNFDKIKQFYEALITIDEMRPILEIVAHSENTEIIFDFENVDCSVVNLLNGHGSLGVTCSNGSIMIGADNTFNEVLATIAHEFTHWTMQLIYKNNMEPFPAGNDSIQFATYDPIIRAYEGGIRDRNCPEIEGVFNNNNYNPEEFSIELIVRVPHLKTLHKDNPETLGAIREVHKTLFEYFEKIVMSDIRRELIMLPDKKEIRQLNEKFGVLEQALNVKNLTVNCNKAIEFNATKFYKTTTPELLLEYMVRRMETRTTDIREESIFIKFEQLLQSETIEKLKKLKKASSEVSPKIIIIGSKDDFVDQLPFSKISELEPIVICSSDHKYLQKDFKPNEEIEFEWDDLDVIGKAKIKKSKIFFQDHEVEISDIVKDESLLKELPLEKLFNPYSIKLKSFDDLLPEKPRVFIERKRTVAVNKREDYDMELGLQDIEMEDTTVEKKKSSFIDIISDNKIVLIAEPPGMGKSILSVQEARNSKRDYKSSWIFFIDLKKHTEILLHNDQIQTAAIDLDFFTRKFLKLDNLFEKKLFESLYADKIVTFVIDGFDEISPKYNKFVLTLLEAIKCSGNFLLITSRPHFTEILETRLETRAIEISPFDEEDQINFLAGYWKNESQNFDLKGPATELLERVKEIWSLGEFFAIPIHIFVLAEFFADQVSTIIRELEASIFKFHKRLIEYKLKVWAQKGPLAEDEFVALQQTFPATNLWQIFYRLALDDLFRSESDKANNLANALGIPKVTDCDWFSTETIERVGIVSYNGVEHAQFFHRTHACFFLADIISKRTFNENDACVILFLEIISNDNAKFQQIFRFLNDMLDDFDATDFRNRCVEILNQNEDLRDTVREKTRLYSNLNRFVTPV